MRHFQIFDKISGFLKNVSTVLDSEKLDYIFEEPLKDTHREKALSNKTVALLKSRSMGI